MTGTPSSNPTARTLDKMVRDPSLRAAITYWDSLRGNQIVPPRLSLDPAVMRPHLQNSAILEVARPGSIRIRLGGARLSALMGMEVRGMPLRAIFDLADRGRISDATEAALATPSILVADAVSPAPRFAPSPEAQLRTQIVILPMSDSTFSITRALYVMGQVEGPDHGIDGPHRWSLTRLRNVPVHVEVPVLEVERMARIRPAAQRDQSTDEAQAERIGAFARARFRVIDGGLA